MAERGRATADRRTDMTAAASITSAAHPDDVALNTIMQRYRRLGDEPPRFDIARNDDAFGAVGAHTNDRHGPHIPLPRDQNAQTIEGRIYGDDPWRSAENWSFRWSDPSSMNRTVNEYVRQNWTEIRSDLALRGRHSGGFDAHHRIGEGFANRGMFGAGPRESQYLTTSLAVIRIALVPGSDPPQPFIVTAFPAGLL